MRTKGVRLDPGLCECKKRLRGMNLFTADLPEKSWSGELGVSVDFRYDYPEDD